MYKHWIKIMGKFTVSIQNHMIDDNRAVLAWLKTGLWLWSVVSQLVFDLLSIFLFLLSFFSLFYKTNLSLTSSSSCKVDPTLWQLVKLVAGRPHASRWCQLFLGQTKGKQEKRMRDRGGGGHTKYNRERKERTKWSCNHICTKSWQIIITNQITKHLTA